MKKFALIFILITLMSVDGNARKPYRVEDLAGCWCAKDSSTVLQLFRDGKYSLVTNFRDDYRGRWFMNGGFIVLIREFPVYGPFEGRTTDDWEMRIVKVCGTNRIFWKTKYKINKHRKHKSRKVGKIYLYKE